MGNGANGKQDRREVKGWEMGCVMEEREHQDDTTRENNKCTEGKQTHHITFMDRDSAHTHSGNHNWFVVVELRLEVKAHTSQSLTTWEISKCQQVNACSRIRLNVAPIVAVPQSHLASHTQQTQLMMSTRQCGAQVTVNMTITPQITRKTEVRQEVGPCNGATYKNESTTRKATNTLIVTTISSTKQRRTKRLQNMCSVNKDRQVTSIARNDIEWNCQVTQEMSTIDHIHNINKTKGLTIAFKWYANTVQLDNPQRKQDKSHSTS